MKGKTNQPLVIVVADCWAHHVRVEELRIAGHDVYSLSEWRCLLAPKAPDAILHPAAHGWCEAMFVTEEKKDGTKYTPYLDAALTAARKRKREAK